ncbi:MAG: hypothetical protein HY738_05680 [Bacteroidia bacterium]|nr:hypothetical protein [Bacteroidia bacterium]
MRQIITFFGFFLVVLNQSLFASDNWIDLNNDGIIDTQVQLISSSQDQSVINFKINAYSLHEVTTPQGAAYIAGFPACSRILKTGVPDLPKITRSIIIPDDKEMRAEVLVSQFIEIENIAIAPSKGNLFRNIDPSTVPYTYGKEYSKNEFFPVTAVTLGEPYILRDYRGQAVILYPFQYNPVSKKLKIFTDITVQISSTGNPGNVNVLNRKNSLQTLNKEFDNIYKRHFLNYTKSQHIRRCYSSICTMEKAKRNSC